MARSPSPEVRLDGSDVALLLDVADGAIVDGLDGRPPSPPPGSRLPAALLRRAGVFVTLTVGGELNGCIGSIEAVEPLGHATARNAWAAAFADPRLPALRPVDYDTLTIEVSVLSPLVAVPAASPRQVLERVRPGVDGLLIADRHRRGLFLPAVWDELPDPHAFLDHLQAKAGIRPGTWPRGMHAWCFTATEFTRRAGGMPTPSEVA